MLCLSNIGAGPLFQCPATANCTSAGSGSWDASSGTLSLTVRFGSVLDSSGRTVLSFRMLNPTDPSIPPSTSVGIRVLFMTSSSWTPVSRLYGSILSSYDRPRFLSASVYESRS